MYTAPHEDGTWEGNSTDADCTTYDSDGACGLCEYLARIVRAVFRALLPARGASNRHLGGAIR